jgi:hypothetical protein
MAGYDGRGIRKPLTIVRGADFSYELTVTEDSVPLDLSAATIAPEVYVAGSSTPTVTMTPTVSGTSSNILTMTLTDAQTLALTGTQYYWTLWVTRGGDRRPWLAGGVVMVDGKAGKFA